MANTRQSEIIGRTAKPVTYARLIRDLRALGVVLGDKLLVHTSMSKLGYVPGGAQAVVEALVICRPGGRGHVQIIPNASSSRFSGRMALQTP